MYERESQSTYDRIVSEPFYHPVCVYSESSERCNCQGTHHAIHVKAHIHKHMHMQVRKVNEKFENQSTYERIVSEPF